MTGHLRRGGYCQECPLPAEQLYYAGGGHPGCGGFVEVLKLSTLSGERTFLQGFVDDVHGARYRWKEYQTDHAALEAARIQWPDVVALRDSAPSRVPIWDALAMTAEQRGMELLGMPMNQLPTLAVQFSQELRRELGGCIEVFLTAWTVYAQCVEGRPCTDPLYIARPNHRHWFQIRSASLVEGESR